MPRRHDLPASTLSSSDPPVVCPSCGAESYAFAPFCISCGEPLDGSSGDATIESNGWVGDGSPDARPAVRTPARAVASAARRWETWLGLALVLIVGGYVLFDWVHSTAVSSAYRDGLDAMLAHDWDRAAAGFEAAGTHMDAPSRLNDTRKRIEERDSIYTSALEAFGRHDWKAAVRDFERVETIQPSYRDTPTLLPQAKQGVLNNSLAGVCYLVGGTGPDAGLYLRGPEGEVWRLNGTDGQSAIRAIAPDGKAFVYDVPITSLMSFVPPQGTQAPVFPERVPLLARIGIDGVRPVIIMMDGLSGTGWGVLGAGGVWWFDNVPAEEGSLPSGPAYYWSDHLTSHPSGLALPVLTPGAANESVVALDPQRDRAIVGTRPNGDDLQTELYLVGPGGSERRLVASLPGAVDDASVSGDGRWLLCTIQSHTSITTRSVYAIRLDATAEGSPPDTRKLETLFWGSGEWHARLEAVLLAPSPPAKVLVQRVLGNNEWFTLYDLDGMTAAQIWYGRPDDADVPDRPAFTSDLEYAVVRRQERDDATLVLAHIGPGLRSWATVPLPLNHTQRAQIAFSPREDYVMVTVPAVSLNRSDIYVARRAEADRLDAPKLLTYSVATMEPLLPQAAMPGEGSALVYILPPNGELRTAPYDGTPGVSLIGSGVKAVWSLQAGLAWGK